MSHKDIEWRPEISGETYAGFEIWDHCVGPYECNCGQADPDWKADDE